MPATTELDHEVYREPEIDPSVYEPIPGTKETEVLQLINVLEEPLLTTLREEYGEERGWFLCGPASILMARFLSALTDVPITPPRYDRRRPNTTEHFELDIGIYYPQNAGQAVDHTLMQYILGEREKGKIGTLESMYIDLVGGLLWGRKTNVHNATRIGFFTQNVWYEIDSDYNLQFFTERRAKRSNIDLWDDGRPSTMADYDDMVIAMHDDRVFQDVFVANSGKVRDVSKFWGTKLLRAAHATLDKIPNDAVDKAKILATLPPLPVDRRIPKRRIH